MLQNRRLSSCPCSCQGEGEETDQIEEVQRGVSGGDQLGTDREDLGYRPSRTGEFNQGKWKVSE